MASNQLKSSKSKKQSAIVPKAKASEVKEFWDREFATYRVSTVKVISRKGAVLKFFLVDRATGDEHGSNGKPFSVNLDDGAMCFSELPSTAPLATKAKPFGLLMLSEAWHKAQKVSPELVMGDPKRPPLASL